MTRMEQAKSGTLTEEIKKAAASEAMECGKMRRRVAEGTVSLVRNTLRDITPLAIGQGCRIKINANIGTSSARCDQNEELEKMRVALKYGADAIMDLSTAGDLAAIRAALLAECRSAPCRCMKWP